MALCFIRACFESEYRLRGSTTKILLNGKGFSKKEKPCKIARIFVGFDTQSVWLFENSLIHPSPQRKTALISADFHGGEGWIRLIAQGCTCANCPSVSTERWFGAHSARRFEKPPIHPINTQKSTSRDTFFVVRGGFAQQRACKFTCQSEVCTPKGGSTRKACGCLKTA